MVQRSGRFKTTHTGCYLSDKAYGAVRRFETTLYGALCRGQSKKRYLHARATINFKEVTCLKAQLIGFSTQTLRFLSPIALARAFPSCS
jgi:hypothetical protein